MPHITQLNVAETAVLETLTCRKAASAELPTMDPGVGGKKSRRMLSGGSWIHGTRRPVSAQHQMPCSPFPFCSSSCSSFCASFKGIASLVRTSLRPRSLELLLRDTWMLFTIASFLGPRAASVDFQVGHRGMESLRARRDAHAEVSEALVA